MMDGWSDGMGAGGWILMTLLWIFLVALIVWAVAQLFPRTGDAERDTARSPEATPKAILDLRLARGEIDVETYDELREKLDEPAREPQKVGG